MAVFIDWSHAKSRYIFASKAAVLENPKFVQHLMLYMLMVEMNRFGVSKHNPAIVAIDTKPYWREEVYNKGKEQFPEYENLTYKGNRIKDEELDWETIEKALYEALDALNAFSDVHVIKVAGAEADDIFAVGADYYAEKGEKVFFVTSDKDMKQCLSNKFVQIYDPVKKIFVPDIDVERYKTIHCIQGDKGDNILAVKKRVAEKTAIKMYPTIKETLASDPDIRARYEFNRSLVDFDYIPEEIKTKIIKELEKDHHHFNAMKLTKAFMKMDLKEMSDNVRVFKFSDTIKETKYNKQHSNKEYEAKQQMMLDNFFKE